MAAVFVCGLCGSSDAVMSSVMRHQQRSHVARGGRHTGPYHRPAGGSVGRMCKGSGIKHVVHTLPSGLQRGRTVVSWAVAPVTAPSVPARGTLGAAGSDDSPAAAGAHSAMQDAGAENTWQEDMDMPDASPTPSALVDVASHSGFGPPHLILAARRPTHSHLSQSLLHRITWHEADSVAQHEVDKHLKGGADKFGNTLPHYTSCFSRPLWVQGCTQHAQIHAVWHLSRSTGDSHSSPQIPCARNSSVCDCIRLPPRYTMSLMHGAF
jgi:hypothetical protein